MSASLGKKVLRWTVLLTPWVLALLLAAGWGLSVWTPRYLEGLVPQLAADMGLPLTEFRIRDAGLFSADIGPVRLGGEDGMRLSNVHVTYTPASLKAGRVNSMELDGISLSCSWDGERFDLPVLGLLPQSEENAGPAELPELPLNEIIIRDSVLLCDIEGTRLSIPFSARLKPGESYDFEGTLRPRDQDISVTGTLGPTANDLSLQLSTTGFRLGAVNDVLPLPVTGRLDLSLGAVLDLSQPDGLTADFTLAARDADLSALGIDLAHDAVVSARGRVAEKAIAFSLDPVSVAAPFPVTVSVAAGRASEDSLFAQFDVEGAGAEVGGRLEADRAGDDWDVALTAVNTDNMTVNASGRIIHLAGFSFSLSGLAGPDRADMVLDCSTRGAALGDTGFKSRGLRLTLPLKWPAPKRHTPGTLKLSGLRFKDRRLGAVTATVRQQGTDLAYGGTLYTDILPKLRVPFSGLASMNSRDATLKFSVDKYVLPAGFDPATLDKSLKGLSLSGTLGVDGAVRVDADGVESRAGATFTDGALAMSEGGTSMTGIRLAVESPDLLSMRTAPAQKLTFAALSAGNIQLTDGEIAFQLEPGPVVLVEEAGFKWAGGHVASRAFRIKAGADEYNLTLFCSNLKLSAILSQLGLAEAQGEAALSGELPVAWKKGKISFNSGFLHSTPGEGGVIQVEAMEDLVSSIPEGTPQRGQLELAREAVRDFEYKWVRIKADTVGEDLLVRLSVDGKPKSTLPFIYRKEFGGFMRVTGDVKGSNFQGLRLDVNFSVPLDRILLYKDIMNMIE
jgi:hypothetical protein